ncbi:MAG: VOC family protein [Verrucomicrobiota bacterium]
MRKCASADSMLMMGQATATWKAEPLSLYLFVENADTAYQRALDAGATSLMPPADQFYGDRTSGVKDAWGNTWWISTHLEDVPSDELQRRAHAARQRRAPA